jgi:hypothetical protein
VNRNQGENTSAGSANRPEVEPHWIAVLFGSIGPIILAGVFILTVTAITRGFDRVNYSAITAVFPLVPLIPIRLVAISQANVLIKLTVIGILGVIGVVAAVSIPSLVIVGNDTLTLVFRFVLVIFFIVPVITGLIAGLYLVRLFGPGQPQSHVDQERPIQVSPDDGNP